jgi:hypothetical protein
MPKTTPTDTHADEDRDDAHLQDLNDGIGCTEIWETLSEQRSERLSDPDPAAD